MKRIFRSFNERVPDRDIIQYRLIGEFVNDDDSPIRNMPGFSTVFAATYRVSRTQASSQSTLEPYVQDKLIHEINAKMDYTLQSHTKPVHPLKAWLEAHR